MNRRAFLSFLLAAPIVGPSVLREAARVAVTTPAGPTVAAVGGPWSMVQFWDKEFDYASKLGIAVEVKHGLTGQTRRNSIRVVARMSDPPGLERARRHGRAALRQWAEDLNGGPVPERAETGRT